MPTRSCAALKLVLRTGVGVLWLSGAQGAEAQAGDARVTSINEAGQRITGKGADAAIGRPLRELVAAADRVRLDRELSTALAARTGTTLEVSVASLAGATVTLELDVRPIYRRSRPAGLQAIGRDVTARKRAEAELARRATRPKPPAVPKASSWPTSAMKCARRSTASSG